MLRNLEKSPSKRQNITLERNYRNAMVQVNQLMRKQNIRSLTRLKSGKHLIYNGTIFYYSTRHSPMGATDEVGVCFIKNEN